MKENVYVDNGGTKMLTELCQCVYTAFYMRLESFCNAVFKRMGC